MVDSIRGILLARARTAREFVLVFFNNNIRLDSDWHVHRIVIFLFFVWRCEFVDEIERPLVGGSFDEDDVHRDSGINFERF